MEKNVSISIAMVLFFLVVVLPTGGCFATKTVSVPMRVSGAAVSVVPVAGNTAHDVIDEVADTVDKVPF